MYTARVVVLRRCHRNQCSARIDAMFEERVEDGRESGRPAISDHPSIEPHVSGSFGTHSAHDRLGDNIARCKVGKGMQLLHETVTLAVEQDCTLPADGLRHQLLLSHGLLPRVEHRWMELHEFGIGDQGACAQCERDAISSCNARVRRLREDLADASGSEHDSWSEHCADAVALALTNHVQCDALDSASRIAQQIDHCSVFDDFDVADLLHCGHQCARHFLADHRADECRLRRGHA